MQCNYLSSLLSSALFVCLATSTQLANAQQDMIQAIQKMQICMAEIDMQKLQALGEQAKAFETELKTLCKSGEHAKATQQAIKFGMEISSNAELKKMRECTKDVGQMAMNMMPDLPDFGAKSGDNNSHICDSYRECVLLWPASEAHRETVIGLKPWRVSHDSRWHFARTIEQKNHSNHFVQLFV